MKKVLIGIVLNGLALWGTTELVEGITYAGGLKLYIFGGIVIGLLNSFVKPMIKILSLPFIILTGGLLLIVINAFILMLASELINFLEIRDVVLQFDGLGTYIMAAVVFGIINWTEHHIIKNK